MRFEDMTSKLIEQAEQIKILKTMVMAKQKEVERLHGFLLLMGLTDLEMETYTYEVIYFLMNNIDEARKRSPGDNNIKLLHKLFYTIQHLRVAGENQMPFRNFKDIDHAKGRINRIFDITGKN